MKAISKLLVVLFVLAGTAVPAAAQVCEPNSMVYKGFLNSQRSCKPLQRDGGARIFPVGELLFEEFKNNAHKALMMWVDGITSSPMKSGIVDRRVTLVTIERGCGYCGQGVVVATQYELRSGDLLQLRTLSSSIKMEVVGITEAEVVLKIR